MMEYDYKMNLNSGLPVSFVDPESLKPKPLAEPKGNWYLFCVFAGSEAKLAEKIGETAYYPRRFVWVKRRGRLENGERRRERKYYPVIPGYIFYNGDPNDAAISWLYNDRKFFGIRAVMTDDGPVFSRVPNVEIHRMRMAELAGAAEVIEVFSVMVGERIEIATGPFAGKIGVVREIEFGRAKMEFPALGRFAKFTISNLGKISFKP